ncbi:DUF559 domain-containing protein [Nocardioides jensenii]|uniref:DUF559 domain-containing protein n=1 Tax=Nocardioides jensenii TaxID=1843 RepID=UPI000A73014D|nr:DUF559 domain-containing protein [Nocardioides jensenii]
MMTAAEAVARLGGVARTRDVTRLSSRTRVRTAVRRGDLVRVARDRLALPITDTALRTAQKVNGHVSHLSAALHHGWEVKHPPALPQVTLRSDKTLLDGHDDFIAETYRRRLRPAERQGWSTSPLRTVLDCARDLPFDVALCVADSALRHGDITKEALIAAARTDRQVRVATYADGRAANPFESTLRAICILIGLPVVPQYTITCGQLVLHPDLANPLLGLAIEADSYTFHGMEPRDHDRDCLRYNALTLAGWTVLRFTWTQVMTNPEQVAHTLRAWLAENRGSAADAEMPRHAG